MKTLFPSAILALSFFGSPLLPAAETKAVPPSAEGSAAAKSALAGQYVGKWKGADDASGELRIMLKRDDAGAWVAESSFTFEGTQVPTKMKSIEVDGAKVRLVFAWDMQGTEGQSKLTGELTGDTMQGTYATSGAAGESSGTWQIKRG